MTSPFRLNQMMVEVRRKLLPVCRCGHPISDHTEDGDCQEPTGRCLCGEKLGLCTTCRHTLDKFDLNAGACTAVNPGADHRCGCTHGPPDDTPTPA